MANLGWRQSSFSNNIFVPLTFPEVFPERTMVNFQSTTISFLLHFITRRAVANKKKYLNRNSTEHNNKNR